jgi:peptidoglycan/xylan/chitin deacetylase (PgdA/CDA1 family)
MAYHDWTELIDEYTCWARRGERATVWWRDDDAVRPSPRLDRLLMFSNRVPISLGVIPRLAEPSLARRLDGCPQVAVLQHGWRHVNYNPDPFAPGSEYPPERSAEVVGAEFAAGRDRLGALFGERALPVFVPPFHGFDDRFMPLLAANRIRGFSGAGNRRMPTAAEGVTQANVHVPTFDWESRRFHGTAATLALILGHLRARRAGQVDPGEPTGILTHHLVEDEECWEFLELFVLITLSHNGAKWLTPRDVFGLAPSGWC